MVLDIKSQRHRLFTATDDEVFTLNYSPDGKYLMFGDRLGSVTLCERQSGRILSKTNAHVPLVLGVAFSPDGRLAASCGTDSSIKLWVVSSTGLRWKATLLGHRGYIPGVAFSPDGSRLVSAGADQTLKLWDLAQEAEVEPWTDTETTFGPFSSRKTATPSTPTATAGITRSDSGRLLRWTAWSRRPRR